MNISIEEMPRELERLLEENERLNNDLGEMTKLFAIEKEKNRQAIEYIEEAQEESGDKESCSLYIPKLLEILKRK